MTLEMIARPLWQRNLLFAAVCILGAGAVVSNLLQTDTVTPLKNHSAALYHKSDFRDVVKLVDAEFAADWDEAGLQPAPLADDLMWIRRLSLGLTGTIPSLQEIRAFEKARVFHAGSKQPPDDRIQWWLSHLFEGRRTSDYLAERFARAFVGVENGPFLIYRRRRFVSWLSNQFHENRPYDKLVRSLITAEGLWTSDPEVNFVTVTVDQNDKKNKPNEVKLAVRVTRAFLGVRIDCVQCHDDHLGDRWRQEDFHQLASFFAGADMNLSGIRENRTNSYKFKYRRERGEKVVLPVVPFRPELLPESGEPRRRLAGWVTHPNNRAFARAAVNRIWALMFGRPLVEPIDEIPLKGPYPPGLETLADDLIQHSFDLQRLIRVIAATRVFGLDSRVSEGHTPLTAEHDQHWAAFALSRLRPEQVAGSIIQAASLTAIDPDSHILFRMARAIQQGEFIKRYGDIGEDEFYFQAGTISQRLMMMNGSLVHKRIEDDLVANAAARILATAHDDETVVEATYLAVLGRRPSPEEARYFVGLLSQKGSTLPTERAKAQKKKQARSRKEKQEDLYWALINSTEFSWNH